MDINYYISQPPGNKLEFFTIDTRGNIPNLFPTICSFLNTDGGVIIIGMSREKDLQFLSDSQVKAFRKDIEEKALHYKAYLNPPYLFYSEEVKFRDANLLVIDIKKSKALHWTQEWIFKRVDSRTLRVEDTQEINEMFLALRPNTESEILTEVTESDLNMDLLGKARLIAKSKDSNHKWLSMTDE